jgi:hypothetical protein
VFVSLSALHYALRAKDAERSLAIARRLRFVPLRYAMRLTALLAEQRHPLYEAAARRLAVRVLEELLDTSLVEIKKLIDVLAHVHDNMYWYEAQCALRDVVSQLHRMQRLDVDFDSLEMRPRKGRDGAEATERPEIPDDFLAELKAVCPVAPADWYDGPLWAQ